VYSLQGYSASSCTEKSANTVTYMAAHQICYVVSLGTVNDDMPGGVHEGVWCADRCILQVKHLLCTHMIDSDFMTYVWAPEVCWSCTLKTSSPKSLLYGLNTGSHNTVQCLGDEIIIPENEQLPLQFLCCQKCGSNIMWNGDSQPCKCFLICTCQCGFCTIAQYVSTVANLLLL